MKSYLVGAGFSVITYLSLFTSGNKKEVPKITPVEQVTVATSEELIKETDLYADVERFEKEMDSLRNTQ